MKKLNTVYIIKRIIGIISILAWIIFILLIASRINNWFSNPNLPVIAHHNILMLGSIILVSGFHPAIWTFDIAIIASIIWLIMQLVYGKHKQS